jgi:hypothetical protein
MALSDAIYSCSQGYQRMLGDGGLAYGEPQSFFNIFSSDAGPSCGADPCFSGYLIWPDAAVWNADGAMPDTVLACCGTGPPCGCNEICWSPDRIQPPHCVPIPADAGP